MTTALPMRRIAAMLLTVGALSAPINMTTADAKVPVAREAAVCPSGTGTTSPNGDAVGCDDVLPALYEGQTIVVPVPVSNDLSVSGAEVHWCGLRKTPAYATVSFVPEGMEVTMDYDFGGFDIKYDLTTNPDADCADKASLATATIHFSVKRPKPGSLKVKDAKQGKLLAHNQNGDPMRLYLSDKNGHVFKVVRVKPYAKKIVSVKGYKQVNYGFTITTQELTTKYAGTKSLSK